MLTDNQGNAVRVTIGSLDEKRGTFLIQFYRRVSGAQVLQTLQLRVCANELALIEERMKSTLRDLFAAPGIRLAREILYVGQMHKAPKNWNPIAAGTLLDELFALGASYGDICEPFVRIALNTMPETRRFLEEQGLYKSSTTEGDEQADPTGSGQTAGSTGPTSSSEPPAQG